MTDPPPPSTGPPPGAQPLPPGAYPPPGGYPYPYPPPYQPKPRHPQAILVVVLGCIATIGGLFTGGLATVTGPFAWAIGARAKRDIAAEPDRWGDEDLVDIGYILGIVGTVLLVLGLMVTAIIVVVIVGLFSG